MHLKKLFFKNIARIITISFIFVTFLPFSGLCIYAYSCLSNNIHQDYYEKSRQLINGIDSNLNIYFKEWNNLTDSIFGSHCIQFALEHPATTDINELNQDSALNTYLMNIVGGRDDIICISLYTNKKKIYENNYWNLENVYPFDKDVIKKLKVNNGKFTIFGPRYQKFSGGYQRNVITIGRQIKDINNGAVIGYMIIDVDYNMLSKTIAMTGNEGNSALMITDNAQRVVFNSENPKDIRNPYQSTSTYQKFTGEKNRLSVAIKSGYLEWNYLLLSNGEVIISKLTQVSVSFIAVGIGSFILFLFCAILISKSVSRPLQMLEKTMETAESNNFNEILPAIDTYDEVNRLARRFNVMLVEIQRLLDREKESWRKEAESEFKALQLQITPHFLYNSLDSINCLAQIHGRKDISEMILSLAGIFKYSMKYNSSTANLEDEINHVKNYCTLQAVHYQDSFHINYDVKEQYMDRRVAKFMLQPLVENAISHGLNESGVGNLISITAYETKDEFIVQISDNGKGMSSETADQLRKKLCLSNSELLKKNKEGSHIGISNVNLRLKLQFGEKAGITFKTEENVGTDMYIHIPLKSSLTM